MKKNILITGPPGCGKTTLIEKVVSGIKVPAMGFLTREIRESGRRSGFSVETLDGKRRTFAHLLIQSRFRVGKYGVDIEALEADAISSLHADSADVLIVIDEIGKMECFSSLFRKTVLDPLAAPNPVLASIAAKGDAFIEGIKSREDVGLHKVSSANRDLLVDTIINRIRSSLKPGGREQ